MRSSVKAFVQGSVTAGTHGWSNTFSVRRSSSVICGGPCAGMGAFAGPGRPEKDAAALAATLSACFCASRSACCLFRRSSSACMRITSLLGYCWEHKAQEALQSLLYALVHFIRLCTWFASRACRLQIACRENVETCLETRASSLLFIPLCCKGLLTSLQLFRHLSPLGCVPCLPLLPGLSGPAVWSLVVMIAGTGLDLWPFKQHSLTLFRGTHMDSF